MSDSLVANGAIDLVRVDSRIWCGEAALKLEDLPPEVQRGLPPKTISKLGRWDIFPKAIIRSLKAHYYEGYELARRHGVSIFRGNAYAIDSRVTPKLVAKLGACKQKFDAARALLLGDYDRLFAEWLQSSVPAEWQGVIAGKLPDAAEVARRIHFGWQVFSIVPSSNDGSSSGGGTFAGAVSEMAGGVFDQLSAQVSTLWNKAKGGLNSVSSWHKVPDYIQALIDKAESTSLFAPEVRVLADALKQAASSACRKGAKPEDAALLKGLLMAAKDPAQCRALCQSGDAALAAAAQQSAAPWLPQPEPAPAPSLPDCSVPLPPAAPSPAELAEAEAVLAGLEAQAPERMPGPEPAPQEPAPDLSEVNPELAAMLGLLA